MPASPTQSLYFGGYTLFRIWLSDAKSQEYINNLVMVKLELTVRLFLQVVWTNAQPDADSRYPRPLAPTGVVEGSSAGSDGG